MAQVGPTDELVSENQNKNRQSIVKYIIRFLVVNFVSLPICMACPTPHSSPASGHHEKEIHIFHGCNSQELQSVSDEM